MNLIISDRPLDLSQADCRGAERIDLSERKIATCLGCFGCWTRTPGRCVIRDDAVSVYPRIAAAERLMYVSRIRYGGYDTVMKTMLERAIPIQQAFIRLYQGETHHVQRSVVPKQAVIIGYGAPDPEEQALFRQLVSRNARNMNFASFRVVFCAQEDLEETVRAEVRLWE